MNDLEGYTDHADEENPPLDDLNRLIDDADDGIDEDPPPTPRRRGRAPRAPASAAAPSEAVLRQQQISEKAAREQDFDSWIAAWPWDDAGMKLKIKRTAPSFDVHGTPAVGVVYEAENEYMTEGDIARKFKGGTYQVMVIGIDHKSRHPNHHRMLAARTIRVPGEPLVQRGQQRASNLSADGEQPNYAQPSYPAPGADYDTMRLMHDGFRDAAVMKQQGVQDLLIEKDRVVSEQRKIAADMVTRALEERDRVQQRLDELSIRLTQRVEEAHGSGTELLKALLPATQEQARSQIASMQQLYETRTATLESAFNQRIEAERRNHDAQLETTKQTYQGVINRLEMDLGHAREEAKRLHELVERLRDQLLTEVQRSNTNNDPQTQLSKLGGLVEMITGLQDNLGANRGGGGDESPNNLMGLFDRALKVVPNITEAVTATAAARMQPQPQQPRVAVPTMQQLAAPPPQIAAAPAPRKPQLAEKLGLSKEELHAELTRAVSFINNVLANPQDQWPSASDFARSAQGVVAGNVLKALAFRDHDRLLVELETKGVLVGRAATPEGKTFLKAMLLECRQLLGGT